MVLPWHRFRTLSLVSDGAVGVKSPPLWPLAADAPSVCREPMALVLPEKLTQRRPCCWSAQSGLGWSFLEVPSPTTRSLHSQVQKLNLNMTGHVQAPSSSSNARVKMDGEKVKVASLEESLEVSLGIHFKDQLGFSHTDLQALTRNSFFFLIVSPFRPLSRPPPDGWWTDH